MVFFIQNYSPNDELLQFQKKTTFVIAMSFPNTFGAFYFENKTVIDFIENHENMCLDYHVSNSDCYQQLFKYCELLTEII